MKIYKLTCNKNHEVVEDIEDMDDLAMSPLDPDTEWIEYGYIKELEKRIEWLIDNHPIPTKLTSKEMWAEAIQACLNVVSRFEYELEGLYDPDEIEACQDYYKNNYK